MYASMQAQHIPVNGLEPLKARDVINSIKMNHAVGHFMLGKKAHCPQKAATHDEY
jgi:hypothetical protein